MSNTKLASYIVLAILLALSIFLIYQFGFDSMQESFVTLGTASDPFPIQDNDDFLNYAHMIQHESELNFPNTTIEDLSANSSLYFQRVDNEDLHFYNENRKYDWDEETIDLYKNFLSTKEGVTFSEDYLNKLRTIYNQNMILELMSRETNRYTFLNSGILVDGSHNLLEPWDDSTMSLTGSQYIVKCHNNQLQKYDLTTFSDIDSSLNGLTFPDGSCNPCDALLDPDDENRYQCKYDLNMQKSIGLSGNGIWNKIWNSFTATATATDSASDTA